MKCPHSDLSRDNLRVVLFQNGIEIPIALLREDASSSAASGKDSAPALLLSNLAPGPYQACLARKQVDAKGSLEHTPKAAVSCDSGQLAAGATLALMLGEKD